MFLPFHDTYCIRKLMCQDLSGKSRFVQSLIFLVGPMNNSNLIAPVKFDEHVLFSLPVVDAIMKNCLRAFSKLAALSDPKLQKRQKFFFKTAKLVERFSKKCQNNPSGNSHI